MMHHITPEQYRQFKLLLRSGGHNNLVSMHNDYKEAVDSTSIESLEKKWSTLGLLSMKERMVHLLNVLLVTGWLTYSQYEKRIETVLKRQHTSRHAQWLEYRDILEMCGLPYEI